MSTLIFIDGSYYIFYRYYALLNWWKFQNKDDDNIDNLHENTEFVEKFIKLFEKNILEIPKKLKIKNPYKIIIGLDCHRNQIWRNDFHDSYKDGRKCDNNIGNFFQIVMENKLFEKSYIDNVLYLNCFEADDCIAFAVKEIQKIQNDKMIYIITNDHDYLQLKTQYVFLYNLKFKEVGEKKSTGDPQKDLFIKAVCGDKSDNIQSIFNKNTLVMRAFKKNLDNFYNEPATFQNFCKVNNDIYYNNYLHNMKLISFDNIPKEYMDEFNKKYGYYLQSSKLLAN